MKDISVGQMLNMTSGIPDFDTAKGHGHGHHGGMSDSLRAELYKNPDKIYTPTELMSVPWVAQQYRPCEDHGPYWHKCYSSTNFMLLGLLLANGTKWDEFDQSHYLPASLKHRLQFAVSGAPQNYTAVHGYDRTSYNMPEGVTFRLLHLLLPTLLPCDHEVIFWPIFVRSFVTVYTTTHLPCVHSTVKTHLLATQASKTTKM